MILKLCILVNSISVNASGINYISTFTSWEKSGNIKGHAYVQSEGYIPKTEITSPQSDTYLVFRKCIINGNEKLDLVIYPYKSSSGNITITNATNTSKTMNVSATCGKVGVDSSKKTIGLSTVQADEHYGMMKLVVTTHVSSGIGTPVSWKGYLGCSDMDGNEGIAINFEYAEHIGEQVYEQTATIDGRTMKVFLGKKDNNNSAGNKEKLWYNIHAVYGKVTIPTGGLVIARLSHGHLGGSLTFEQGFVDEIEDNICDHVGTTTTVTDRSGSCYGSNTHKHCTRCGADWDYKYEAVDHTWNSEKYRDNNGITNGERYEPCSNNIHARNIKYKLITHTSVGTSSTSGDGWYSKGAYASIDVTVKDKWHWVGWTGTSSLSSKGTQIYMDKAHEITAHASTNHTVEYILNGGTDGPQRQHEFNEESTQAFTIGIPEPKKDKCKFLGWTLENIGDIEGYRGADYKTGDTIYLGEDEEVRLYALWKIQHFVEFRANTGVGIMADQEYEIGEQFKLNKNLFTKRGYTYTHWNLKADDTSTRYNDEQIVTFYY